MSTQPRITDEEMQYFQFKAKQMFLLQKDDHEWNQFCKRNKCTCCLCQPQIGTKVSKEVGIQASSANNPNKINKITSFRTGIQSRNLPQTLNEIKTKLDKIDHSLSQMHVSPQNEFAVNQMLPHIKAPTSSSASGRNTINDKRLELIQNSLKGSIQRLQSAAAWKWRPISLNAQKKSSGFVLPRDLQEQRVIARRAYLASLAKLGTKNKTTDALNAGPRARNVKKRPGQNQIAKSGNVSKTKVIHKKKSDMQLRKEINDSDITTAVQSSEIMDENIENAVDGIVDDLIAETVLAVNKIKYVKRNKVAERIREVKNEQQSKSSGISRVVENSLTNEEDSQNQHKSHWETIRTNLLKLKTAMGTETIATTSTNKTTQKRSEQSNRHQVDLSQNTIPKSVGKPVLETFEQDKRTALFIDSKSAKETSKQRSLFWKYLEQISHTKKGNFDPWTLSNMVAESLLDDCLLDVCQELDDIPTSLITELYDQEFLESL